MSELVGYDIPLSTGDFTWEGAAVWKDGRVDNDMKRGDSARQGEYTICDELLPIYARRRDRNRNLHAQ